jgi:hypothetical protein
MKNIYSLFDNQEENSIDPESFVTDSTGIPLTTREDEPVTFNKPEFIDGQMSPAELPMMPESESVQGSINDFENSIVEDRPLSVSDRFLKQINDQKKLDNEDYQKQFEGSNKMQLYGNLLRGFQNMIQNSVSMANPRFQADMGVAENLNKQGQDLVSEFYKRKQNERSQEDQVGNNLVTEMNLESKDIDLSAKKDMNLPNTKLAENYIKLAKLNKALKDVDITNLSAQQASDLAKQAMEADQLTNLAKFRDATIANRQFGQSLTADRNQLNKDKFDYQKDEQDQKQKESVRKDFNKDKTVAKAYEQISSASNVEALVNSDNPIGHAAIPTFLARAAGEVGALTEADKGPFAGTRDLSGLVNQIIEQYKSGKLTRENKKFILDLVSVMKNSANKNIRNVANREADKISRANKLDKNEAKDLLLPPSKVRTPNGKLVLVPQSQLDAALKAGGVLVNE